MNIKHSNKSCNWGTPLDIVEAAKQVLGPIHLDPATSSEHVEIVGAWFNWDEDRDATTIPYWCATPSTIFMNPPSGRIYKSCDYPYNLTYPGRLTRYNTKMRSLPAFFWFKLLETKRDGLLNHAIVVAYSLEQLQTTQGYNWESMAEHLICIPKKRLKYRGEGNSPTHGSAIIYVPGLVNESAKFAYHFSQFGIITRGIA